MNTPLVRSKGSQFHAMEKSIPCRAQSPFFSFQERPAPLDSKVIEKRLAEAYQDPRNVIEDREKSPESSIVLFTLISSCFPGVRNADRPIPKPENCPAVNVNEIIKLHPIEILEKAAEQGSVDAKLIYAMNAPMASLQLRKLGTEDSVGAAREVTRRAERFGSEAAQAGNIDAMRYMSSSYESGRFGVRDMQKAYMFMLPLDVFGTPVDKKRISDLGSKLTDAQREEAKISSFGCDQNQSEEVLNNPFG